MTTTVGRRALRSTIRGALIDVSVFGVSPTTGSARVERPDKVDVMRGLPSAPYTAIRRMWR